MCAKKIAISQHCTFKTNFMPAMKNIVSTTTARRLHLKSHTSAQQTGL